MKTLTPTFIILFLGTFAMAQAHAGWTSSNGARRYEVLCQLWENGEIGEGKSVEAAYTPGSTPLSLKGERFVLKDLISGSEATNIVMKEIGKKENKNYVYQVFGGYSVGISLVGGPSFRCDKVGR